MHHLIRFLSVSLCLCGVLWLVGCTTVRPPEEVTQSELPRPVVVIGGIFDPGVAATYIGRWIKAHGQEQRVVAVSPGLDLSFDAAARQVIEAVENAFPSDDPNETVEVDVIGVSMGGIVARHAAAPESKLPKRLNIKRLYTLAAPHSGAQGANLFGFFGTASAMRTNSPFLRRLARREQQTPEDDYPITQYARPRDFTIGRGAALPPHVDGQIIWLTTPWYLTGHTLIHADQRILRDILRRLRNEPVGDIRFGEDEGK